MALGRKTGGRKPGSLNRSTIERIENTERLVEVLGLTQEDVDAHTLMTRIYRSPDVELPFRFEAAKAAIRHEKPTLAASTNEVSGPDGGPITTEIKLVLVPSRRADEPALPVDAD
jgi:hypothetical protein